MSIYRRTIQQQANIRDHDDEEEKLDRHDQQQQTTTIPIFAHHNKQQQEEPSQLKNQQVPHGYDMFVKQFNMHVYNAGKYSSRHDLDLVADLNPMNEDDFVEEQHYCHVLFPFKNQTIQGITYTFDEMLHWDVTDAERFRHEQSQEEFSKALAALETYTLQLLQAGEQFNQIDRQRRVFEDTIKAGQPFVLQTPYTTFCSHCCVITKQPLDHIVTASHQHHALCYCIPCTLKFHVVKKWLELRHAQCGRILAAMDYY